MGLYLIESGDTIVSYIGGTVTGEIETEEGTLTPLIFVKFLTDEGEIGTPTGPEHTLQWEIADTSIAQVIKHAGEDWEFHIDGKAEGTTTIEISIFHNDHPDFVSKQIPIHVEHGSGMGHGEPEGLILIQESTGDTLVTYDEHDSLLVGQVSVQSGQHTGHIAVQFFDHNGVFFTPDPADHSLQFTVADTTIAVTEQHDPQAEPWAFEVEGKQQGNTSFIISLFHLSHSDFTTPDIPIQVTQ
jgi:hypothetical protein